VTRQVLALVGNSTQSRGDGTFPLRDLLKSSGYEYIPGVWIHWRKAYVAKNFTLDELRNELWAKEDEVIQKSGVEVRLIVSPNIEFAKYQINTNNWQTILEKYDLLESALEEEQYSLSGDHIRIDQ
jgi:DNA helicase-4